MPSDRKIRPSPKTRSSNSKLKIRRGPEVDLLTIHHGLFRQAPTNGKGHRRSGWILGGNNVVSGQLSHPELHAIGSEEAKEARQFFGGGLVHAKHVGRFRVAAPQEWVSGGTEPKRMFSKGCLPTLHVEHDLSIQQ